jgi:microcystin-dependent protein
MAQPYVGEIRMFGGNFAPAGWMFCSGQLLPISEYETLFNLIGTTYGGDGQSTFGLPNLQSRVPMHMGTGAGLGTVTLAETGGAETVTLTTQQIPQHNHPMLATAASSGQPPTGNMPAPAGSTVAGLQPYQPSGGATTLLKSTMLQMSGGNQPHGNIQPYLCISFIISLFGIFPTPT